MASESSNITDHRRPTTTGKTQNHHLLAPPHKEHIPCPRCDSANTKFCYYNNYNFSQPRHFCKSCRRYWTHGGALRDVPVGGGTRKRAKRLRVSTDSDDIPAPVVVTTHIGSGYVGTTTTTAAPVLMPFAGVHGGGMSCSGFTSVLSSGQSLGGIFGVGFDQDLSFGLGRTVWPFSGVGDSGVGGSPAVSGGGNIGWLLESGDGSGGGGAECFAFPELAISTPGNAMK